MSPEVYLVEPCAPTCIPFRESARELCGLDPLRGWKCQGPTGAPRRSESELSGWWLSIVTNTPPKWAAFTSMSAELGMPPEMLRTRAGGDHGRPPAPCGSPTPATARSGGSARPEWTPTNTGRRNTSPGTLDRSAESSAEITVGPSPRALRGAPSTVVDVEISITRIKQQPRRDSLPARERVPYSNHPFLHA